MRKSSSHAPGNTSTGSNNKFKKDTGSKPYGKDAKPFKKNYDGRQSDPGGKPSRSSAPYSGRVAGNDQPRRPFDKPFSGKENRPGGSKPFKSNNEDRPFRERPNRSFDKPFSEKEPRSGHSKPHKPGSENRPFRERPNRSFDKPSSEKEQRPGRTNPHKPNNEDRPFTERPKRSFDKPFTGKEKRTNGDDRPKRSFDKPAFKKDNNAGDDRKPRREEKDKNSFSERSKRLFDREPRNIDGADTPAGKENDKKNADSRPFRQRPVHSDKPTFSKDIDDNGENSKYSKPFEGKNRRPSENKPDTNFGKKKHFHDHTDKDRRKKISADEDDEEGDEDKEINQKEGPRLEMPLNKYIAHSGECSRRDAAELVRKGKVKVNGELVLDPGYRVLHDDKVTMSGKKLTPQKGMVYILLNKPKGFITTNEDPQGRKTVMELVGNSGVDRLFPVGRLDRDTSGLLLITNDGDLTQKLCHPSYAVKKVYQVTLDKALTKADFEQIVVGVELEDGKAIVDEIAYLEKKNELGLEIHSGRNRIVRRIFESLGYEVVKLDRVMYAGLTKKNLPRSKWRYLDEREVVLLKHFKI